MSACRFWLTTITLLSLLSGAALAGEYTTFTAWARANAGHVPPGEPTLAFGDVVDSFPSNSLAAVGLAYDEAENGIWLANEDGGELLLIDVEAPHGVLRSINVQGLNLTTDGNQDGVAVVGDNLFLTDFEGDQYLADDLIFQLDRVSGALMGWWYIDGPLNPNPDAAINMVLGISTDGAGNFWVTDNEANLHNITLLPGGDWVRNSVQTVPGGGSWAGIDYDTCLEQYFTANFGAGTLGYHTAMPAAPAMTAAAAGADITGITSNNDGAVWTVGFTDGVIYRHEGIGCSVPVTGSTWGGIKGIYR